MPYDPERDMIPASLTWELPNVFVVASDHVPAKSVAEFIAWAKQKGDDEVSTVGRNANVRNELVDRYIEVSVAKMLSYRVIDMQNRGLIPNSEASSAKLFVTELVQRIARTSIRMAGLYGQVWDEKSPFAQYEGEFARAYVNSVGLTIAGGTSEIQRNIIAQRGLGMPRS